MRQSHWLALILAVALALRLGATLKAAGHPLQGDAVSYDQIAWNLCTGHGYALGTAATGFTPTASRGPSYVDLLAGCYALAGHRIVVPMVLQALLDLAAALLVFRLASRWFGRPAVGLLAAALFAVYPAFVKQSAEVLTETFTGVLVLAVVASFFDWLDRRRGASLLGCGLALALLALSKPQLAPVGFVLALAAVPAVGWRAAATAFAATTAVVLALMAPWMVRNALVFHAFVPGLTQGGISFWGGTAPIAGKMVGGLSDPWVPDSLRRSILALDELQQSNRMVHMGVQVIAADPGAYARLCVRKFLQLWFSIAYDTPTAHNLAHGAVHLAAFALAAFAARVARPDPTATRAVAGLGLLWTLVYLPFCTQDRYAMTYFPLLFCFTAAGVLFLVPRGSASRPTEPLPR